MNPIHRFGLLLLMIAAFPCALSAQPVNDPLYPQQTYLHHIGIESAWDITTGLPAQKIAIIGGGNVRPTHEDLGVKTTIPFQKQRTPSAYQPSLATGVAGIAAAVTNNGLGIAGINQHASILSYDPGDLLSVGGQPLPYHVPKLSAIGTDVNSAVADGAGVLLMPLVFFPDDQINLRFGSIPDVHAQGGQTQGGDGMTGYLFASAKNILEALYNAAVNGHHWNQALSSVHAAYLNDRIVVAPMGDFDGTGAAFPAGLAHDRLVIAVGSTDPSGLFGYEFSASGNTNPEASSIDVVAPGVNLMTTLRSGDDAYGPLTSTAGAAGIVAGTASLLQAAKPDLSPDDIREVLRRTAVDIGTPGFDSKTGFGRIDAAAALA